MIMMILQQCTSGFQHSLLKPYSVLRICIHFKLPAFTLVEGIHGNFFHLSKWDILEPSRHRVPKEARSQKPWILILFLFLERG